MLSLNNIFVSRDFITFLVGHKNILKEVSLNTCYVDPTLGGTDRDINCIYWSELFTSMVSAFTLVGYGIPFPEEKTIEDIYKEESDKVRNIL